MDVPPLDSFYTQFRYEKHSEVNCRLIGLVTFTVSKPFYPTQAIVKIVPILPNQRNEGANAIRLNSLTNVVQTYAYYVHSGSLVVFMRYYEESSLDKYLAKVRDSGGKLTEVKLLTMMVDIAKAVHSFHSNRFAHRDIKPHNVFLTADLSCKLGDLENAKEISMEDWASLQSQHAGTPAYMSPERCTMYRQGSRPTYNHEAFSEDIYALGKTFYDMCSGGIDDEQMPQIEESLIDKVKMKVKNRNYSSQLADLIIEMMLDSPNTEHVLTQLTEMLEALQPPQYSPMVLEPPQYSPVVLKPPPKPPLAVKLPPKPSFGEQPPQKPSLVVKLPPKPSHAEQPPQKPSLTVQLPQKPSLEVQPHQHSPPAIHSPQQSPVVLHSYQYSSVVPQQPQYSSMVPQQPQYSSEVQRPPAVQLSKDRTFPQFNPPPASVPAIRCEKCKPRIPPSVIKFPDCAHSYCTPCLSRIITEQLRDPRTKFIEDINCPCCNHPIELSFLRDQKDCITEDMLTKLIMLDELSQVGTCSCGRRTYSKVTHNPDTFPVPYVYTFSACRCKGKICSWCSKKGGHEHFYGQRKCKKFPYYR